MIVLLKKEDSKFRNRDIFRERSVEIYLYCKRSDVFDSLVYTNRTSNVNLAYWTKLKSNVLKYNSIKEKI